MERATGHRTALLDGAPALWQPRLSKAPLGCVSRSPERASSIGWLDPSTDQRARDKAVARRGPSAVAALRFRIGWVSRTGSAAPDLQIDPTCAAYLAAVKPDLLTLDAGEDSWIKPSTLSVEVEQPQGVPVVQHGVGLLACLRWV
jgi:hypothetical protein